MLTYAVSWKCPKWKIRTWCFCIFAWWRLRIKDGQTAFDSLCARPNAKVRIYVCRDVKSRDVIHLYLYPCLFVEACVIHLRKNIFDTGNLTSAGKRSRPVQTKVVRIPSHHPIIFRVNIFQDYKYNQCIRPTGINEKGQKWCQLFTKHNINIFYAFLCIFYTPEPTGINGKGQKAAFSLCSTLLAPSQHRALK